MEEKSLYSVMYSAAVLRLSWSAQDSPGDRLVKLFIYKHYYQVNGSWLLMSLKFRMKYPPKYKKIWLYIGFELFWSFSFKSSSAVLKRPQVVYSKLILFTTLVATSHEIECSSNFIIPCTLGVWVLPQITESAIIECFHCTNWTVNAF